MNNKTQTLDVLVVGAGVAGLYLVHRLRQLGLTVKAVDRASDVGGTWYWNRYPGARCDVDSMFYSYGFDEDLEQEWTWTERYAAQPEILAYLSHVAYRFDLRKDILFNTSISAASYDEENRSWHLTTGDGEMLQASFCVMATGCLSATNKPVFPGQNTFQGAIYHTGDWPHEGVDFAGQRVGVIGTGSSGVQAIPEIALEAEHLTVFQRTANYVVPAQNRPLEEDEIAAVKSKYQELRAFARTTPGGFNFAPGDKSALEVTEQERATEYEKRWQIGGIPFMGAFNDLALNEEANQTAQDFVREKIRDILTDPPLAEMLCPDTVIGCKRLSLGTGYFETFNRANVSLVDVSSASIDRITKDGLAVDGKEYALDSLVFATGFDAMTGALSRINISGRHGIKLKDEWAAGPRTFLGLAMAGFPNLFIVTGPGSPSVLSNMLPTIEQHVEWISDCIAHLRDKGFASIEAERSVQNDWVDHVNDLAAKTLRYTCNSWYLGANVPGKPRVFMPYIGGMPAYRDKCDQVAANGYEGFDLSP